MLRRMLVNAKSFLFANSPTHRRCAGSLHRRLVIEQLEKRLTLDASSGDPFWYVDPALASDPRVGAELSLAATGFRNHGENMPVEMQQTGEKGISPIIGSSNWTYPLFTLEIKNSRLTGNKSTSVLFGNYGGGILSLPLPLHAGDQRGGGHAQGIGEPEERIERRRHLVVFQPADVGAVNLGVEGQLLLRHAGFQPGLFQNIAKHAGQLSCLAA